MIKIENTEVVGWEAAIRGMRNPLNSWEKSDSGYGCGMIKNIFATNAPVHSIVQAEKKRTISAQMTTTS